MDATKALPVDPAVLQVDGLPVVGCGRLRCDRCRVAVRNVTRMTVVRSELTDAEHAALYERQDLASSALLRPGYNHFRLYVCRCSHWLETSERSCSELKPDRPPFLYDDSEAPQREHASPGPSWQCAGHPQSAIPHDPGVLAVASQTKPRVASAKGAGAQHTAPMAAAPARALDDPRLQLALDSLAFRETLADSNDALGRFLRAAGAFSHEWYEEIDFTDWNGAIVGRGAGALLRAAIPPSVDLPYSELAPLLQLGATGREIVARHPSTPKAAAAPLGPAHAAEARRPVVLTRGAGFALGYLPAELMALFLRRVQTDAAVGSTDPALRHAVDFSRRGLGIEASLVAKTNERLREVIRSAGLVLPPVPTALSDVATFLEEMAGALSAAEPSVRAAWQSGVVARDLLVALGCAAHESYLRCAAPFDARLAATARRREAELQKAAAAWPESMASLGLPGAFPIALPADLAPTAVEGYKALSEAVSTLKQTFTRVERALDEPPASDRGAVARSCLNDASVLRELGDLPRAAAMLRKAVAAFRALGDMAGEGGALRELAQLARHGGWHEEALASSQAAVACFEKLGDRPNEAMELSSIGHTLHALGRHTDAVVCFNQSLTLSEQLNLDFLTGSNCFALATITPATPRFAWLGRSLATRSAAAFRRAARNDLAADAEALLARFTTGDGRV